MENGEWRMEKSSLYSNERDTRVFLWHGGQEEPRRGTGEVDGAVRENGKMGK
jgi:hypothetical protein